MDCIECTQILSKIRDGASANEGLVAAAQNQAFFLTATVLERLRFEGGIEGVTVRQFMRYSNILGQWAVKDSDLDMVAVIIAKTDNEEISSALETAL